MAGGPPFGNLSLMTYGHEQPPSGWPPPSESGPRPPGRRRAPEGEDEPPLGYGGPTFQAPPPPPVAEPPYRPRRAHADPARLSDRYAPRRAVPDPGPDPPAGHASAPAAQAPSVAP